jgi:orotidine-5'-phosphate decarboxylase
MRGDGVTVQHFGERLMEAIRARRSHVVVGLDPDYELVPARVRDAHPLEAYESEAQMKVACFREFLNGILEAVADDAVAVKIQLAYFEALGAAGYQLYEDLVEPARNKGLLVIADAKRGDIGSTAEAYAKAHLDVANADALTVNPYLGTDSVEPFLRRAREVGKGLFVLVKTSNPSSVDIQDLELISGERVYARVAELVKEWGRGMRPDGGYSSVGAVVGGTHPKEGAELRRLMPGVPFLVPGYGAQGAAADDLRGFFDERGLGAVVNSSRAILYAYRKHADVTWQEAARLETRDMKAAIARASGLE